MVWRPASPEETFDEATALGRILRTNARLSLPFALSTQHLRYDVAWQRQTSNTPLTSQDQFAIGGRWTVRGFDGERTLNADCGWLVRNDLSWQTRLPEPSSIWRRLRRGRWQRHGVPDGQPSCRWRRGLARCALESGIRRLRGRAVFPPGRFKTSPATFGFNLNMDF
jgi:hypothetical protein